MAVNFIKKVPFFITAIFFLAVSLGNLVANNCYSFQDCVTEIFDQKKLAVVRVFGVHKADSASEDSASEPLLKIGTGFFISREGHVMTVAETVADVVNEAQAIWVVYNKVPYPAELVGLDNNTNIAIVRLLKPPSNIPFLHLGESLEVPKPSTMLLAVTSTLGLEPGPSMGMVTAWQTDFFDKYFPTTFLRSNIPLTRGEAGSPVFDIMGRFAGVMVFSIDEIYSSFIVPARAVMHIRDDLVFSGKVSYAYLGVDLDEKALMTSDCCILKEVIKGGPAEQAGLKNGDKILEFDNVPIQNLMDFRNATFFARSGQIVSIKVQRDNKEVKLPVRLIERPAFLVNVAKTQPEIVSEKQQEMPITVLAETNSSTSQKKVESIIKKNNYWNTYLKAL